MLHFSQVGMLVFHNLEPGYSLSAEGEGGGGGGLSCVRWVATAFGTVILL